MDNQDLVNTVGFQSLLERLQKFISIKTITGLTEDNKRGVSFVVSSLKKAGFNVQISGDNEIEQPVIIGRRKAVKSKKRIVIYGHYDVAEVDSPENWISEDPFHTEVINNRIYGRGIADNKATLLTRILALEELSNNGSPLPEILWLIQGKEEVNQTCIVTRNIFKDEIKGYEGRVYLDETGFNDLNTGESILFLWTKSISGLPVLTSEYFMSLIDVDRVENRHLNKLNGGENCPLLTSLPEDAIYLGFGPNDRLHNIHQPNESLDIHRLEKHFVDFGKFMSAYAIK